MEQIQLEAVIAAAGMCTVYNADDWTPSAPLAPAPVEVPTIEIPPSLN